jgi:glycosyltransferase involved in cell wall biosynthesis
MKNIIFFSFLNLWSMDKGKGAPSFHKTVEAYIKDGWNVVLINPKYNVGYTPMIEGVRNITFSPIFFSFTKIKKLGFLFRILHSLQGDYMFYKLGKNVLEELGNEAVIYSYEVDGVKAGKKLRERFSLPFVTRFQGTILAPIEDNWINRLKKYPHFQALQTNADITIMTDDGTQGDRVLRKLNNQSSQIRFWKNGVDISTESSISVIEIDRLRNQLGLLPEDKVLITVSRLASWKKVNRAIEALSMIVREKENVRLVIVGDGDEKQNLIKLTKELNLTSNVIFVGSIPQAEVRNYLDLADVFLSLYDLSNVGNPLLEAMSCGKSIITLNVGDTGTLIKNEVNGILLDINHLDMIPKYIHKILDDKKYSESLGNNAKQYAEENFWSWNERMKAEVDIVNELNKNFMLESERRNNSNVS